MLRCETSKIEAVSSSTEHRSLLYNFSDRGVLRLLHLDGKFPYVW